MKLQTVTKRKYGFLVAGALALISQSAVAGDADSSDARAAGQDVITVTAERPRTIRVDGFEPELEGLLEAIDRRIETDLQKRIDRIGRDTIELVISEVPTRG